jgi:hypothetical protein
MRVKRREMVNSPAGGVAVGVASDSLSGFQRAVILQEIRDSARTERVG